jgi:hypothetical protein
MAIQVNSVERAPSLWFKRVMWWGIATNLALAIPIVIRPDAMLTAFRLPVPSVIMWPRFAALLLVLLSLFYMPAAVDPDRYRASAALAVASRLAGTLFFFLLHRDYWALGAIDLVFLVPLALLLMRLRAASSAT